MFRHQLFDGLWGRIFGAWRENDVELIEKHVIARSLNPIENAWSLLKRNVRQSLRPHFDLNEEGVCNKAWTANNQPLDQDDAYTDRLSERASGWGDELLRTPKTAFLRASPARLERATHEVITIRYMYINTSKPLKACKFPQSLSLANTNFHQLSSDPVVWIAV